MQSASHGELRLCRRLQLDDAAAAALLAAMRAGNSSRSAAVLTPRAPQGYVPPFPCEDMATAVEITSGRALLEASGNVTAENIRSIAETGVDIISLGALTHSVKCFDISMRIEK